MHDADDAGPASPTADGGRASPLLRTAAAALIGVLAVVFVAPLRDAPPQTGRLDRRVEIVELIRLEQQRVSALAAQVEELSAQVASYEQDGVGEGDGHAQLRTRIAELAAPAGLVAVTGPGLQVTLQDSRGSPPRGADLNNYIIHEEDLQAVINALWAGGAEAMSINGNRILSTTAIRCVGNVLLLHGSTHSPPYEIVAIGDAAELGDALDRDTAVARFATAVQRYQLGFEVASGDELRVPGFEGVSAMQVARPLEAS